LAYRGKSQTYPRYPPAFSFSAARGANVILPPELFEGPYFCRQERDEFFELARPAEAHPTIERFRGLARELQVAIPVSFFERAGQASYNRMAMVDADGALTKGGGGAPFRAKAVALAAARFVVIVTEDKLVARLGAFPTPVEVVPFALRAVSTAIARRFPRVRLTRRGASSPS